MQPLNRFSLPVVEVIDQLPQACLGLDVVLFGTQSKPLFCYFLIFLLSMAIVEAEAIEDLGAGIASFGTFSPQFLPIAILFDPVATTDAILQ